MFNVIYALYLKYGSRLDAEGPGYPDGPLQDDLEEEVLGVLVRVVRVPDDVEGTPPGQHLVEQHAQRPPVHREGVVLPAQDLRRDVVGGAAEGGGGVSLPDALLAHAVVGQLDVALVVQEDVVQLEVSVDDAALVEEVECQADLGRVESGVLLRESALALHVEHEVPAAHELDDEEEPARRLEARVQPDQERVVGGRLEDVLLRLHPVDVLVVRHQLLLDDLHGVDALRRLELHHQHLGVAAPPDHAHQLKVGERHHGRGGVSLGLGLGGAGRGGEDLLHGGDLVPSRRPVRAASPVLDLGDDGALRAAVAVALGKVRNLRRTAIQGGEWRGDNNAK